MKWLASEVAVVSGALGFVGFFVGAIFLVLAYFILRGAPRPQLSAELSKAPDGAGS
jgi:hypothetical protein